MQSGKYLMKRRKQKVYDKRRTMDEIGLIFSRQTRDFWDKMMLPKIYGSPVGWYNLLTENHLPFQLISDESISLDRLKKYKLIIAPNFVTVSNQQYQVIKEYVKLGGNFIATYRFGFMNEIGDYRGDTFLRELCGVKSLWNNKSIADGHLLSMIIKILFIKDTHLSLNH